MFNDEIYKQIDLSYNKNSKIYPFYIIFYYSIIKPGIILTNLIIRKSIKNYTTKNTSTPIIKEEINSKKEYKEENNSSEDNKQCIICLSEKREYLIIPCGHLCLCQNCKKNFKKRDSKCPICRNKINFIQKVYDI